MERVSGEAPGEMERVPAGDPSIAARHADEIHVLVVPDRDRRFDPPHERDRGPGLRFRGATWARVVRWVGDWVPAEGESRLRSTPATRRRSAAPGPISRSPPRLAAAGIAALKKHRAAMIAGIVSRIVGPMCGSHFTSTLWRILRRCGGPRGRHGYPPERVPTDAPAISRAAIESAQGRGSEAPRRWRR